MNFVSGKVSVEGHLEKNYLICYNIPKFGKIILSIGGYKIEETNLVSYFSNVLMHFFPFSGTSTAEGSVRIRPGHS